MGVSGDIVEAIRLKLDIADVVSDYVPNLQRSGKNLKGLCPFHNEKTPSFIVSPERQTFHCFGCGEGGDAFSFLMKVENLTFPEALEKLAAKTGVPLVQSEKKDRNYEEKMGLKAILDFASSFYHGELLRSPAAEPARKYLANRKVSKESLERFQLGFVPDSNIFLEAARKKGFSEPRLLSAGVAVKINGRLRPSFFGRILFPIRDSKGGVVGFGGRVLNSEIQPKYLNSAESLLFSKSRILYGVFEGLSSIRSNREIILMEGYLDVLMAHQYGIESAVAPLGTAITSEHAKTIKRYGAKTVIAFDPDSAGRTAALRSAEILLPEDIDVRIAVLPEDKDPDEILIEKGAAAFKALLDKALDPAAFKTEILLSGQKGPLTSSKKSEVAHEVFALISKTSDEVLRSDWLRSLSQRLQISEDSLRMEFKKEADKKFRFRRPYDPNGGRDELKTSPVKVEASPFERQVLCLMMKNPSLASIADETHFRSPDAQATWQALLAVEPHLPGWPARLLESAGPAKPLASELLMIAESMEGEDPQQELNRIFTRRRLEERLQELEGRIHSQQEGELHPDLRLEYQKVLCELKGSR